MTKSNARWQLTKKVYADTQSAMECGVSFQLLDIVHNQTNILATPRLTMWLELQEHFRPLIQKGDVL